MARTSPAPNVPPIPGMCPGVAVMGGGGGGGGAGGKGSKKGKGKKGAGKKKGKKGANGGKKNGKCGGGANGQCSRCGTSVPRGDPIDVGTGGVFTESAADLDLPGPLPLHFHRHYESSNADRDFGLGFGWSHSFAARLEVHRGRVEYWDEGGVLTEFPSLRPGDQAIGGGLLLRHHGEELVIDTLEERYLHFAPVVGRSDHPLVAISDNNGNRISLQWDGSSLVQVVDSVGRIVRFERGRDGRMGGIVVENAPYPGQQHQAVQYLHDDRGDLVAVRDAAGHVARYVYDAEHYLVAETQPDGLTFHFVYDHLRRCTESWGAYPDGSVPGLSPDVPQILADGVTKAKGLLHVRLAYLGDGYVEVADSKTVQRYFFDEHGKITKAVSGDAVSERSYDAGGHLLAYTDPLGARTAWTRDRFGRIITEESPRGNVTVTEYDEHGRVVGQCDALGRIAQLHRDARGNVVERVMSMGDVTRLSYDARGLLVDEWFPDGTHNRYDYDAHGNLVRVTRHNGASWQYSYDGLGRMLTETNPAGETQRWAYDPRGLVTRHEFADGSVATWEWDGRRNLQRAVDGDGRAMTFTYNGRDQVVSYQQPDGAMFQKLYDREESLVAVVNERTETRALEYNVNGDVVSVSSFDGRRVDYVLDANGQVVEFRTATGPMRFIRGVDGQVETVEYPDGTSASFEYDVRGRLVRAQGESGGQPWATVWERNGAGFAVREIQTFAGHSEFIERTFDAMRRDIGLLTSLQHETRVQRDELGLLRSLRFDGGPSVDLVRDVVGREVRRILDSRASIESAWSPVSQLAQRRVVVGVPNAAEPDWRGGDPPGLTVRKSFEYSLGGTLTSRSDRDFGPRSYAHDPRARVTDVHRGRDLVESYWHDATSNVYERGTSRTYGSGNELESRGDTSYQWDAEGRLIEKIRLLSDGTQERWLYGWDGAGNLARVERPDGTVVEFYYDAFARRLGKRVTRNNGAETTVVRSARFVWNHDRLLHEVEHDVDGGDAILERTFAYDDDGAPIAHRERRTEGQQTVVGGWVYYVNDNLGTPEHVIAADGHVVGRLEHTAYGVTKVEGTSTPLRFRGQYADEETGLHYNRYRYYDPEIGRYISQDRAATAPDPNLYRYTHNPLVMFDEFGLHDAFGWLTPAGATQPTLLGNSDTGANAHTSGGGLGLPGTQTALGNMPAQYPTNNNPLSMHNSYRPADTERQILREANATGQGQGSNLEILGQARPCRRCRTAMARWARRNNATVTYRYTGQPHMAGAAGTGSGQFQVGPSGQPTWRENAATHNQTFDTNTNPTAARNIFNNIGNASGGTQMGGPTGGVDPATVAQPVHYTDF